MYLYGGKYDKIEAQHTPKPKDLHVNKVKNLWYYAYRFMWHCFFCVGVGSCGTTLWKLSRIEFQTEKQNYHKNGEQVVDGVSEWWWMVCMWRMVYKMMVMVVVWTWMYYTLHLTSILRPIITLWFFVWIRNNDFILFEMA